MRLGSTGTHLIWKEQGGAVFFACAYGMWENCPVSYGFIREIMCMALLSDISSGQINANCNSVQPCGSEGCRCQRKYIRIGGGEKLALNGFRWLCSKELYDFDPDCTG